MSNVPDDEDGNLGKIFLGGQEEALLHKEGHVSLKPPRECFSVKLTNTISEIRDHIEERINRNQERITHLGRDSLHVEEVLQELRHHRQQLLPPSDPSPHLSLHRRHCVKRRSTPSLSLHRNRRVKRKLLSWGELTK